jgi:hypothetical protein
MYEEMYMLCGKYRAYTKEWCGYAYKFTLDTAPFFCVCPV